MRSLDDQRDRMQALEAGAAGKSAGCCDLVAASTAVE
jgi:hypothetical protein